MIANAHQLPVITPASTNPANEIAKKLTGRDYVSWSAGAGRAGGWQRGFRPRPAARGRGWEDPHRECHRSLWCD